jgi:hypothetical protein
MNPTDSGGTNAEGKRNGGEGRIRTFVGYRRQIYSLLPLATRVPLRLDPAFLSLFPSSRRGADGQTRTGNLLITNQVLYQLSYIGTAKFIVGSSAHPPGRPARSSLQTPRRDAQCARTNAPGSGIETRAGINRAARCQTTLTKTPCFSGSHACLACPPPARSRHRPIAGCRKSGSDADLMRCVNPGSEPDFRGFRRGSHRGAGRWQWRRPRTR